ncbi:MAG TPA: NAD(P)-binding domain-containing protein, partial [Mesotoga infera]|nr:NAD(P)-binding domain-containing protein [Mesotoga infera]
MKKNTISIIGMGYIGLPTATMFAAAGYRVKGVDVNKRVIDTLKSGKIHIVEPDLQGLFKSVLDSGNLIPTDTLEESDVFIICVPTPFKEDHEEKLADLSFVESASREVGKVLKRGDLVILESTVPPRTTDDIMGKALEEESGLKINEDFLVAHCPERVLPGKIL